MVAQTTSPMHPYHAGIFALQDLPEELVAGKYEGHRVDAAGNIVRRCVLTDILFSFRQSRELFITLTLLSKLTPSLQTRIEQREHKDRIFQVTLGILFAKSRKRQN